MLWIRIRKNFKKIVISLVLARYLESGITKIVDSFFMRTLRDTRERSGETELLIHSDFNNLYKLKVVHKTPWKKTAFFSQLLHLFPLSEMTKQVLQISPSHFTFP